MEKQVKYHVVAEHIAIITLNRPNAANALSRQLLDELNQIIATINLDREIYCTILTGSGENAFCAGADLKERKTLSDDQVVATVRYIGGTIRKIEQMNMPIIAAINGVALGGGMEIALACDFRIATSNAMLGLPETSLAIIPGAGGTQRLARLIGVGQAKRLIYTAQPVRADEALQLGLVEQVIESQDVLDETISIAKKIISNGPIALRQAKIAIDKGMQTDITTALTIEQLCYQVTIPTSDRLEGLKAFAEKRQPDYRGI